MCEGTKLKKKSFVLNVYISFFCCMNMDAKWNEKLGHQFNANRCPDTGFTPTCECVCGGWGRGRVDGGHLSTAAARASDPIGGLGWRLAWFPSPISAADLPAATPASGNTETVQPRSPDSRLVVRPN